MAGVPFELSKLRFQSLNLIRLQHVGVVVDAAAERRHIEGDGNRCVDQKTKRKQNTATQLYRMAVSRIMK